MKMILKIVLIVVAYIALTLGIDILITAAIYKVICWAFGLTFSWRIAVGISFVILLLQSAFKASVTVNK